MRLWLLLIGLLLCVGCAPNNPAAPIAQAPALDSAWGTVLTIGSAEQGAAPAIFTQADRVTALWTEADDNGIYHVWRQINLNGGATDVIRLPVLAYYPQSYRIDRVGGNLHVLWLDADPDAVGDGVRIWGTIISNEGDVENGAHLLTDRAVGTWTAYRDTSNTLWIRSTDSNRAEPTLYIRSVDAQNRPGREEVLLQNAAFPAIYTDVNDVAQLVWMQPTNGNVLTTSLNTNGTLGSPGVVIGQAPDLDRGDQIMGLNAATDSHHRYLLWNITRGDGTAETWVSVAPHLESTWSPPARIGIRGDAVTASFETGFGSTSAQTTTNGTQWADFGAAVAVSPLDRLPLAAQINGTLGIVYLQGASVIGWQPLADLPEPGLIAPPRLLLDADRHLTLSWSQPVVGAPAGLNLISTR